MSFPSLQNTARIRQLKNCSAIVFQHIITKHDGNSAKGLLIVTKPGENSAMEYFILRVYSTTKDVLL